MLKKLLNKLKTKKETKPVPILKAKPNKDRPSKEALLRFLENYQKVIKMEGGNKASLILNKSNSMTRVGGIYIYSTIQVLKYLKVEITNKQEIINYLEKHKRPDTGVYIAPSSTLNLNDSIRYLNIFKLLEYKVNNSELKESLISFTTKKNKLKRYTRQDFVGFYQILKLMSQLNMAIDKEYWREKVTQYQLPSGYYSQNPTTNSYTIGHTELCIDILKILGYKSDSPYLRKALDGFKNYYKGNYVFDYGYKNNKDIAYLPEVFNNLKLFQGLESYGYKEDFIQAVYDSWSDNCFHKYINNHKKPIYTIEQAEALEILDILGGQKLIDEVMQ